jgi:hypothetical protein
MIFQFGNQTRLLFDLHDNLLIKSLTIGFYAVRLSGI